MNFARLSPRLAVLACAGAFSLLLAVASGSDTAAQDAQTPAALANAVQLTEIASGFERPLYVTDAGDASGRLFVVEQVGTIWVLPADGGERTVFLDVSDLISSDVFSGGYTERGLLGLAFHPDYASNGVFFINYTDRAGNTVVARYNVSAADPNAADPASAAIILTQEQPYANHNGGHLEFGPDGYLWIGMGDGGSQGDPQNHAQNPQTLLGALLRIDVDSGTPYGIPPDNPGMSNPAFAPEVWAIGLRNPWRFSFDRETGDLWVGDVGQNWLEEINYVPAGTPGGVNFGWNIYEADDPYSGAADPGGLTMPIAQYTHNEGISVTGGYVYRGSALPMLDGVYLYGDFGFGTIWAAWQDSAGAWQSEVFMPPTGSTISSFGEDEAGELYLVDYNGALLRFAPVGS